MPRPVSMVRGKIFPGFRVPSSMSLAEVEALVMPEQTTAKRTQERDEVDADPFGPFGNRFGPVPRPPGASPYCGSFLPGATMGGSPLRA